MRDFPGCCKNGRYIDTQCGCGKGLKFLTKNNGVGTTRTYEFQLLWSEGRGDIHELGFPLVQFLGFCIDGKHLAGFHGVGLLKDGVAVSV